eukprot:TRINITY_DN4126_c0_g1_i1.p1 TRINITY_DN4126_c0_g1~~TRINITY_DN4126_c0_g1_i1.p1  ORF type:complete len:321 (+),score=15.67 TRINITY_DN4126_c0_g1_i1:27-965(+)
MDASAADAAGAPPPPRGSASYADIAAGRAPLHPPPGGPVGVFSTHQEYLDILAKFMPTFRRPLFWTPPAASGYSKLEFGKALGRVCPGMVINVNKDSGIFTVHARDDAAEDTLLHTKFFMPDGAPVQLSREASPPVVLRVCAEGLTAENARPFLQALGDLTGVRLETTSTRPPIPLSSVIASFRRAPAFFVWHPQPVTVNGWSLHWDFTSKTSCSLCDKIGHADAQCPGNPPPSLASSMAASAARRNQRTPPPLRHLDLNKLFVGPAAPVNGAAAPARASPAPARNATPAPAAPDKGAGLGSAAPGAPWQWE